MPTLFDMMANAQNGQGMEMLARQFGLSQQQAQQAVEALMPAFSQGLKRNASDPYGIGSFMTALASGQHAKYFEDAQNAFSPQGVAEGNGILGHLFGSKDCRAPLPNRRRRRPESASRACSRCCRSSPR